MKFCLNTTRKRTTKLPFLSLVSKLLPTVVHTTNVLRLILFPKFKTPKEKKNFARIKKLFINFYLFIIFVKENLSSMKFVVSVG